MQSRIQPPFFYLDGTKTINITLHLHQKKLTVHKMPWDFSIWWNPTYNMVRFAMIYHEPIDKITDEHSMKLCNYELKDYEWKTVEEL